MNDSTSRTCHASPSPPDDATVVVDPWTCPSWCGGPLKHYFEPSGDGMDSSRTHELVIIDMPLRDALSRRRGRGPATSVSVIVCQDEVLRASGSGGVVLEAPFVLLVSGWHHLNARDARQLGGALLEAASRLDVVASASSMGQQR